MSYPQYFTQIYINPSGNIEASGYYMAYETQEMANRYPYWTDIRSDSTSVGQQFLSPFGMTSHDLSKKLTESLNEKFIGLAPVDEIDVITRMKIPSSISFLNNPKITCWTAPSGVTPSGYPFPMPEAGTSNVIQITEKEDLEEFYYYVLPTRLKAYDEMDYSEGLATSLGVSFPVRPSGIEEPYSKHVDTWKRDHDITWAHADNDGVEFLRQDSETMESYNTYNVSASGVPRGFTFYRGKMYWVGENEYGSFGNKTGSIDGSVTSTETNVYIGSNVTPTETIVLEGVWLHVNTSGGTTQAQLRTESLGTVLGTLLASSEIVDNDIESAWKYFEFTTPYTVVAGTTYTICSYHPTTGTYSGLDYTDA